MGGCRLSLGRTVQILYIRLARMRIARALVPLTFVVLAAGPSQAEPYMSIRYGYKCSQCHVNPTGGGKRNRFGVLFSQTTLPARPLGAADIERFRSLLRPAAPSPGEGSGSGSNAPGPLDPLDPTEPVRPSGSGTGTPGPIELPPAPPEKPLPSVLTDGYVTDFLAVGADLRMAEVSSFPRGGSATTSFEVLEANVYGSLEVADDLLTIYFDETLAPGGAASREAFGLFRGPLGSYLKGGRIMLPFGLRIQDDAAFIRDATGFNFGSQDLGVEAGIEPGPFSASLAVSNGTGGTSDDNRDKQITGMVSFIQRGWRLGAQGTWNNEVSGRRAAVGGHGGLNVGRLALLGEVDLVIDETFGADGDTAQRLVGYGEVDYLLARGLNLKFTYDFEDPDMSVDEDAFTRIGGGVEWFPVQFTQLRLLAHYRDEADRSGLVDTVAVTFEVHLFF
jgi:hypothetical protein